MKPMESLEQLKARAYDCLVQIESWQQKLQALNQQIINFKTDGKGPNESSPA
jgi:hypothetical protein